jgi:hypothetical protein
MRTEEPRPVRLKDYRPPDWLIETVDLDVSLDPTATTVRAKLTPNGAGAAAGVAGEPCVRRRLLHPGTPVPKGGSPPASRRPQGDPLGRSRRAAGQRAALVRSFG